MCAQIASITPERVFGRRVREARERRGWSQARLADQLREIGHPADRTIVSKIEKGVRTRASIGEVLAYASALGVAPIHLLVPREDEEQVGVTPSVVLPALVARAWIRGEVTLSDNDLASHLTEMPESELRALIGRGWPQQSDLARALGVQDTRDEAIDEAMAALVTRLERLGFRRDTGQEGNDG